MSRPWEQRIIKIGNQDLYVLEDRVRYSINEVLPAKGFKFQFSLRDRVLREALRVAKPLEIVFQEFPEITIMHNPIRWLALGKMKQEVKNFKNHPMVFYYYNVDWRGEISKKPSAENQEVLFRSEQQEL